MTRSPPPRFCSTWGLKPTHVWQWYWPITSTIIMRSTTGSPRNPKATGVWKWCDALRKAKASCCCPNVGWSNAPSPGWVGVVATAKTMSVVQIQPNRCCGSVLCTSCSSDLNPPRFIPHSAIEWRHRRLFGETLRPEDHVTRQERLVMGLIPGYENDIFTSYAHNDNRSVFGFKWVD